MNSEVDFAAGGVILIDDKILLVKNRLSEEYAGDYDSGFWGYPKGHLDDEETPIKAAEREVYEETGFKVSAVGKKPIAESRYCLLYTSPSPRDISGSRMPSSA